MLCDIILVIAFTFLSLNFEKTTTKIVISLDISCKSKYDPKNFTTQMLFKRNLTISSFNTTLLSVRYISSHGKLGRIAHIDFPAPLSYSGAPT